MASANHEPITVVKDRARESVFNERPSRALAAPGDRPYPLLDAGLGELDSAQPVYRSRVAGFALAHNGNLTNADGARGRGGMHHLDALRHRPGRRTARGRR